MKLVIMAKGKDPADDEWGRLLSRVDFMLECHAPGYFAALVPNAQDKIRPRQESERPIEDMI